MKNLIKEIKNKFPFNKETDCKEKYIEIIQDYIYEEIIMEFWQLTIIFVHSMIILVIPFLTMVPFSCTCSRDSKKCENVPIIQWSWPLTWGH